LDGQWGSASGQFEFRSVKPNGTDDRLEFVDSLGALPFYAWSPDGGSLCFSRRTPTGNYDIFVRDLVSGKERRLTSLEKISRFVFWGLNDQIFFTSNVNGNHNVWVMPSSGGEPVQVTRGSGPDFAPVVSADGSRLLFVQQQTIGKIWLGSLTGEEPRQLTFDDVNISNPQISPKGNRVLYVQYTPAPSGSTNELFVMDVETGRKSLILKHEDAIHSAKWSPDGKWIAYASHPDTVEHDSSKAFFIDADNQGSPRRIGVGLPERWIDDRTLLTSTSAGVRVSTVDETTSEIYFRDSTYAMPVLEGKYIIYADVVVGRNPGLWIVPAQPPGASPAKPRQLIKSLSNWIYSPAGGCLYFISTQNELIRLTLPDGKEEVVRGNLPHLRPLMDISISSDGSGIVYRDQKSIRKMIMIENLQ